MRRILLSISTVLLALSLVACFGPEKIPPQSTYTIKPLKPGTTRVNSYAQSTLLVSDPVASPGYKSADMRYMMTPYKLQSFSQNKWVSPPAEMLLPNIVQALANTGRFKAVVTTPFSGLTNYNLQTDILEFEQNFMHPQSRFVLSMQADLVNSKTNKLVASRRFRIVEPATQNTPFGGVMAANRAVAKANAQLARFVVSNLR